MKCNARGREINRKKTTTMCALFATVFFFMIAPVAVWAHSPASIALSYNIATQTLTVTLVHTTSSPNSHYIEKVAIKKNGAEADTVTYKSQPGSSEFSYTYKISAKVGDKLEVKASCNRFGSKTEKLIVKTQAT